MQLCTAAFTYLVQAEFAKIFLQEPDNAASDTFTRRSGLQTLVGSAATEVVGFRVDYQGPADRTSNTHQAQIVIHTVDTRHSILPDLNIAEIADVT